MIFVLNVPARGTHHNIVVRTAQYKVIDIDDPFVIGIA